MALARASIVVGGSLMLVVGIAHVFFPRVFNWRDAFARLRGLDAKVLFTIHLALILLALALGAVSLGYADELGRGTGLGGAITAMLAGFWLWRLVWQIAYFAPRNQTPGRWLVIHYAWIALFALLAVAYSWPVAARVFG